MVAWRGLPEYATRCLGEAIRLGYVDPRILISGSPQCSEQLYAMHLGRSPVSIEPRIRNWRQLSMEVPHIFVKTGWALPPFQRLAAEVDRHGGTVVSMVDNTIRPGVRQWVGRKLLTSIFDRSADMYWVPGAASRCLLASSGVDTKDIIEGLYGCDRDLYHMGADGNCRECDFLFVGQFIERKGLIELSNAVRQLRRLKIPFTIKAMGAGPLAHVLEEADIPIVSHSPGSKVACQMRDAKFLVLPSRHEHWGVVVHEATASGCGLVISDQVGSRFEFAHHDNAVIFKAGDSQSLATSMRDVLQWDQARWSIASNVSRSLSTQCGLDSFMRGLEIIATRYNRVAR